MTPSTGDVNADGVPPCDYILVIATSSEEDALKEAARRLKLTFQRRTVPGRGKYFDLGRLPGENGSRLIAIRVDGMGAHGFGGSASKAIFFQRASGAQAIICLGMAFGLDRAAQKPGDVLVSVGLLPYDDRIVICADGAPHRYEYDRDRVRMHPSKESLVRLFERHRDALSAQHHGVHFGVLLSGSLRIQCAAYRDTLVKDAGAASARHVEGGELPEIIGGEMEGIGLLSTSSKDNPIWIVVKGISDFADGKELDRFPERRASACENAAEFVLRALAREDESRRSS